MSGTASYQRLGFWTGSKSDWNVALTARPLAGVNVTANYGHSGVSLPEGDFSTQLYRLLAGVDMTPCWTSCCTSVGAFSSVFSRLTRCPPRSPYSLAMSASDLP